ncbi:AAA family ATPase [Microbacterium sp. YY-01]|uniref:AAA family ATPase n=1 Tax=Microbacterium sp. YY-01 TaxID=3421634 RepID=UPI003D16B944
MMRIALAVRERAETMAADLEAEGVEIVAQVAPDAVLPPVRLPRGADALVLTAERGVLTTDLIDACDRAGTRLVLIGGGDAELRRARRRGLVPPLPADATAWDVLDALDTGGPAIAKTERAPQGRVVAVWGAEGAAGSSTVAIELAAQLCERDRRVVMIDADTHAPAIALLLGLIDDGPGIAAACRRAELGSLDDDELTRLAEVFETNRGSFDVLVGLNRPSRWPEISADRLKKTLDICRGWADDIVVDIASPLEADEELMSDIEVPRRNAAARSALEQADHIVAVASADPLGIARFLRGHAELRALATHTPTTVLVNRLRSSALGLDARGQIRRSLERFAGVRDVQFLPDDPKAADAALLHARPLSDVAAKSALVAAMRRVARRLAAHDAASRSH